MIPRMFRRWEPLSAQQVQQIADAATVQTYTNGSLGNGPYMPDYAHALVGKKFHMHFPDGPDCQYDFCDLHTLTLTQKAQQIRCYYMGHSIRPGVFFIQHMLPCSVPPQCRTLIVDENTSLVTLCHAQLGNAASAREVSHTFYFGRLGTGSTATPLHHYTDELIGKAIVWTYHHDDFYVKHIYSSEYFYTYAMLTPQGCWMASNPADFIKIAPDLYVFSFLEERQGGTQAVFLMDLAAMHDVGGFFGISPSRQLECYTVGARGQWAEPYTCFEKLSAQK